MNWPLINAETFSLSGLILGIISTILVLVLLFYGKTKSHKIWALFNFSVAWWGFGVFFMGMAKDATHSISITKIAYVGVTFIPVFFYHFSTVFSGINRRPLIYFVYIQGILFSFLSLTNIVPFISNSELIKFSSLYYIRSSGFVYNLSLVIWICLVSLGFIETIFQFLKEPKGIKRSQYLYLFLGFFLGFSGGLTNFLPVYGFDIVPPGNFTITFYCIVSTYAILRYKLLDIKIAITRAGVFFIVYALVLGLPFYLYAIGIKLIALFVMLALATVGPFIFIYLQRRAEGQILREEKRIYDIIKKASAGMVGIREMQKLLIILINVLKNNLHLDHISVYLFDLNENAYILRSSKPEDKEGVIIRNNHPLFERLKKTRHPVFYDQMLYLKDNSKSENGHIDEIIKQMQELSASVIIPAVKKDESLNENVLLAFIVLGKREGKEVFSDELLDVLSIVGNEFALAIEIILSLIERDKLLNENFEIRRFESLGLLCNSMSHQMNNRFMGQVSLLFNPLDIYNEGKYKEFSKEELINLLEDLADSCKRVDAIAKEGGKLTKDILNFSRGKMEFGVVKFDDTVNQSFNFLEQKHPNFKYEFIKDYPKDVLLWGSELGIKDLIYNAVDNSCFSMKKKQEKVKDYKPVVIIRGKGNEMMFYFEIEDNGLGIKKEDLKKVMDPMFTTKSHKDGSGMGTTFMQQIVQKHNGTISYDGEWEQWAKVKISLPLATKEQKGEIKNV